jgi:ribosomal protein S18 acetylase RimI-like enzyme
MLSFRHFRNTDPPLITEIWRSRGRQPGIMHPISVDVFEQFVFAKLYFDYQGLILALDDGRPVGFAHAGFGPDSQLRWIGSETGVICMVAVRPGCGVPEQEIASGLLSHCEDYLRRRGVTDVVGGPAEPWAPFYWGLYGGVKPPGVLPSDTVTLDLLRSHGYQEQARTLILSRDLNSFRPIVDRQQMLYRRQMAVEIQADPVSRSRWEASTVGDFDLTRYSVGPRGNVGPLATALVRSMDCCSSTCLGPTVGLLHLEVDSASRRQGLASFLLGEAFRQLQRQGIGSIETQVHQDDATAQSLFRKLGFTEVGYGSVFRKQIQAA